MSRLSRMVDAAAALERFAAAVDRERIGVYGVEIRIGSGRAVHRWRSDDRENLYSVSKGVCALATGIAIDEGLLTLDLTVGEVFEGWDLGSGVASVTLRDLLTMSSGIDFLWFGDQPVPGDDLAATMLALPSRGRAFQYSDASTYVAMRMLGSLVGDVRDFLVPRLFDPLEIDNPQWLRCPLGHILGGTGLLLRTGELARIGDLLLDRGTWRGQQLVSADWVDGMHGSWVETGREDPMDRYGLATWGGPGPDAWRLEGRYGQFVVVNGDAVVTITAHEEELEDRLSELAVEVTS